MSEATKEFHQVKDPQAARTAAYAEKPFRDALRTYRESLSPVEQKALEKVAAEEGETALRAYDEKQSLEDPRVRALRYIAESTIKLTVPNLRPEEEQRIKPALKQRGLRLVDQIITDPTLDWREKSRRIQVIGPALNRGVTSALFTRNTLRLCINHWRDVGLREPEIIPALEGYFLAKIMAGDPYQGIQALEEMAELVGGDSRPADFIKDRLPILNEVRTQHPDLRKELDRAMGRKYFLWSPPVLDIPGTYIQLEGPSSSSLS